MLLHLDAKKPQLEKQGFEYKCTYRMLTEKEKNDVQHVRGTKL